MTGSECKIYHTWFGMELVKMRICKRRNVRTQCSVLSAQCSVLDVCAVPVETWLAWGAAGGVDVTGVD